MAQFDTQMYRDYADNSRRSLSDLVSGIQGAASGYMQMKNQEQQNEMQTKQLELQQQAGQRQQAEFDRGQQEAQAKRAGDLSKTVGEMSGGILAMKDPQQQQAAYAKLRGELINGGHAKPQELPEDFQVARPMAEFYSAKHLKTQQAEALKLQKEKAEIAKLYAEANKARNGGGRAPKGFKYGTNPETGELMLVPELKTLPAETASKIGNYLGAAEAASGIETLGAGEQETGKLSAAGDWIAELFGAQSQPRAKFLADVGTQRNQVMSRIAGANVTADEKTRVQEGIPTRIDAPDQFRGKAISTTDKLIRDAQSEIEAVEAAGYDASGLKAKLVKFQSDVAAKRKIAEQQIAEQKRRAGGLGMNEAQAAGSKPDYSRMTDAQLAELHAQKFGGR